MEYKMKNTLLSVVIGGLAVLTVVGGTAISYKIQQRREEARIQKDTEWEAYRQILRDKACSNSVHYIGRDGYFWHGNDVSGLGWSEERCNKCNEGAL